jgi:hypothetical protein
MINPMRPITSVAPALYVSGNVNPSPQRCCKFTRSGSFELKSSGCSSDHQPQGPDIGFAKQKSRNTARSAFQTRALKKT